MSDAFWSFVTGSAVGLVFGVLHLPIPAPTVIAGVVGVFGVWAGYQLSLLLPEVVKWLS